MSPKLGLIATEVPKASRNRGQSLKSLRTVSATLDFRKLPDFRKLLALSEGLQSAKSSSKGLNNISFTVPAEKKEIQCN